MWSFKNILNENPPMTEILRDCSGKHNLRLVIYHLDKNHVECATERDAEKYQLDRSVTDKLAEVARAPHAILAYDIQERNVYMVDSAPELNVCSAILLCVLTEVMNGSNTVCESHNTAHRCGMRNHEIERLAREQAALAMEQERMARTQSRGFDFEPNVGYQPMIGIGNLGCGLD